jgi:molybdate transport system substrate-binding protein
MRLIALIRTASLIVLFGLAGAAPASADQILVFAAASLKNALDAAAQEFEKSGDTVKISYAASSLLAKQIENGAPADIFISADLDWMDYVEKKNQVKAGTRSNLLSNNLVLVAPADAAPPVDIKANFPLARLLGDGRLAMADPDAVPAGKYGKAALEKLGVWAAVEPKLARAQDVRAALRFVSRKEAPYGIVYQTDAVADTGVKIVGTFPDGSYPTIIYPIAETVSAKPAAAKLLGFLKSPEARPFFAKEGFSVLP